MSWEVIGGLITVAVGAITYAVKKYVDLKVDKALAGQLDVLRKAHIERFDTVVRIKGIVAEIDHCMDHISKGHVDYSQRCKDWCMKVRQDTRSMIALLGEDFVSRIKISTDIAIEYSGKPSVELYEHWKNQLDSIHSAADTDLRVLKAGPTANNSVNPTP